MLKNIGSNWALNLLQIAVLMQLTPFVLETVGHDQNGVWIGIVSMTGFLRLLVLGVPMASVKSIAEAVGKRDLAAVNRAVSTCLGITLAMGLVALAVGYVQSFVFDREYLSGTLGAALTTEQAEAARIAFLVSALQVAAAFATRLPYGILDAHDDFVVRNAVMCGELALRLLLTLIVLPARPTLATLAWIQVATMVAEFLAAWICLVTRHRGVRFGLRHFEAAKVRGILSFSVYAMLLNVGTLLAFRCDALVIGARLDAAATTQFDVGNKFFEPLTGLVIGIGAVVMPAATRMKASGDVQALRGVLLKWSKISFSLVLGVGLFLLVLGPEFLAVWTGPEFEGPSGRVLRILMASFLVYLPVRGVALPILMGLGRPLPPTIALLAMGLVNVGLSIALVDSLGIEGVALGTSLPNLGFSLVVGVIACRQVGVGALEFARYVLLKPLLGALVPLGVLVACKQAVRVDSWPELIATGLAMSAAFGATWLVFVVRDDPWIELPARLRFTRRSP
ncbi:MAG: polysaccharide biosynthesis protein [Planctomycetes bacterium]|nr:polysaccharide biosynthesis protein [Planctomycetota bacterium]